MGSDALLLVYLAPDVPDNLVGDCVRLQQVLINPVGNATVGDREGCIQAGMDGFCQVLPLSFVR